MLMINSFLGVITLLGNVAKLPKWIKNIAVMELSSNYCFNIGNYQEQLTNPFLVG